MLCRYKKIEGDSRFQRRKIEDISFLNNREQLPVILLSFIFFYLPLTPFIYMASETC